uniref:PIR Superfamily Protein n=1 Tax=Panagrolaimus sp. ES5 TaxID=591445 RepID=A0AC34F8S4_9BILA
MLKDLFNVYYEKVKTWEGIEEICNGSEALRECFGKELTEKCMNFKDFLYFRNSMYDRIYVTNFLQVDYYCHQGNEILKNNYDCLIDKFPNFEHRLDDNPQCEERFKFFESATKRTARECGIKAACFTKTMYALE